MTQTYYTGGRKKRVSSRLVKKQQSQVWKQVWMFVVAAVILILVFIFVLMPIILNVLFPNSENTGLFNQDTIPPQVPSLSAPPQATFSAQIAVDGFGEAESEVILVLNDEEYERATISEEGSFGFEVQLKEGSNTIAAYSIDAAGNESANSREFSVELDREPPEIVITEPTDGQSFELRKNQTIDIKGETEPQASVTINGRTIFATSDGSFSTRYTLQEGENIITVEVTDKAGNRSQTEFTVSFSLG